jgi:hypothetical protein
MRIEGMDVLWSALLLGVVVSLGALSTPARAQEGYQVVPGTLINAIGKWVSNTGLVKADDTTSYGPARLIAVGVKAAAAGAVATEGMARIAYLAVDPKTQEPKGQTEFEFEINFAWKDAAWVYSGASQVAVAEGNEKLTPVAYFNPPPPKPKLGVLPGEEGKPVQTTASGLKYVVLEEGKGDKPKKGQTISAEYTGWLADNGTEFDTSKDHGGSFDFAVGEGNVIPGWDEALLDMKVGERRKLIVPANLAYGEQGAGEVIPAGATLVFEVKLVGIK